MFQGHSLVSVVECQSCYSSRHLGHKLSIYFLRSTRQSPVMASSRIGAVSSSTCDPSISTRTPDCVRFLLKLILSKINLSKKQLEHQVNQEAVIVAPQEKQGPNKRGYVKRTEREEWDLKEVHEQLLKVKLIKY